MALKQGMYACTLCGCRWRRNHSIFGRHHAGAFACETLASLVYWNRCVSHNQVSREIRSTVLMVLYVPVEYSLASGAALDIHGSTFIL